MGWNDLVEPVYQWDLTTAAPSSIHFFTVYVQDILA